MRPPRSPAAHLRAACQALSCSYAVLGPADDGGFYLLGLNSCPPGLLADIPWSSAATCAQTEARLRLAGMPLRTLDPLPDVDTVADLARLRDRLARMPELSAPHTRQWLNEHTW